MSLTIAVSDDLNVPHDLRRRVFIEEQNIPEAEEWDDLDAGAIHLVARDDGEPVGTARLILSGPTGRITRVCVLPPWRGRGVGAALIRDGIVRFQAAGLAQAELSAQVAAQSFYERLGFLARGGVYDDAGIPHITMLRALTPVGA